jgi:hypothetical protein
MLGLATHGPILSFHMKAAFSVLIATLLPFDSAMAQTENEWQSWPLASHFTINVSAMFPKLDTRVIVDASDTSLGTTIDFEQNLGMSDTESLPMIGFNWRYAKKHQLNLAAFKLDRSGSAITPTNINIGDETFPVDLPIASFFDMSVINLKYSYSLVFDEKKELAFGAGLSVQDISFGLLGEVPLGIIEFESGLTAPVPTFDLLGRYAFTDKWIGQLGIGVFSFDLALSDEEELSGDVLNVYASIQHKTFEHVYFGLSYNYIEVEVDWSENSLASSIGYEYRGPMLTVTAEF